MKKTKLKFGIVELSLGMVIKTGSSFQRMRREVESHSPSRWDNPVLVVLPKGFRFRQEEGDFGDFIYKHYGEKDEDNWVVAVPQSGWGYGARYAEKVNINRRKFGLPGSFKPSGEMKSVLGFRNGLRGQTFSEGMINVLQNLEFLGEPEDAEGLRESSKQIHKLVQDQKSATKEAEDIIKGS